LLDGLPPRRAPYGRFMPCGSRRPNSRRRIAPTVVRLRGEAPGSERPSASGIWATADVAYDNSWHDTTAGRLRAASGSNT